MTQPQTLQILINKDDLEKLKTLSCQKGMGYSTLARVIILEFLKKEGDSSKAD